MTLALAWVRSFGQSQELVCATDSRLRFGGFWDCGPKLFSTGRGDSAVMFAGDTIYAYPIINHIISCIGQHPKLRSRGLDLPELKGHLVRVLNASLSLVQDLPGGVDAIPKVEFIFTGYDWRRRRFCGWLFRHNPIARRFTALRMGRLQGPQNKTKRIAVSGDYKIEFRKRLVALLKQKGNLASGGFDMEPFEVLRDMIREGTFELIGGPPQMVKIYRHLNCLPHAVYWPDRASGKISLNGRVLLDYEAHDFLSLDPDTCQVIEEDAAETEDKEEVLD